MDAVIYTTNTGSTKRYAEMLAQKTGLSAYSLKQAKKAVSPGAEVIYLGWIMASTIKGYNAAAKQYKICAACGVGMAKTGTEQKNIREKTQIPAGIPVFTLQGDFDIKNLHGIYRPMMELMVKTLGKNLADKQNKTPEEEDMLDMMLHGGERVKADNLQEILQWYASEIR